MPAGRPKIDPNKQKKCKDCEIVKFYSEFNYGTSRCKACRKIIDQARYIRKKEQLNA